MANYTENQKIRIDDVQLIVGIVAKDGVAGVNRFDQVNGDYLPEPERQTVKASRDVVAVAIAANELENLGDVDSVALSVPAEVFPRLREAQKYLEQGMDPEDIKGKLVKAWMVQKNPDLAEVLGEFVDVLADVEVPVLLLKNLNAYRWELNPVETYAAGLKNGQEVTFTNSVAKIGDKEVHVQGTRRFSGTVKVTVADQEFDKADGTKGINASVERLDKPTDGLLNLRDILASASSALHRAKRISAKKSA